MALWDLFDDMFEPSFYSFHDFMPRRTVPLRILCHPGQNGAQAEGEQSGALAQQSHWSDTVPLGGGFQPSDVTIKYGKDSVTVNAKKQHHQQDRRGEIYSLMETTRTVSVPDDVDPKAVKAFLTPHGEIKLIAPAPPKQEEPMETAEGSDTWKLNLNLEGFKPEELNVKVKGNMLTVDAEQKDKGDGHQWHRKVTRVVTVPGNVDADQLQSVRSESGVLKLFAPFKKAEQLAPPERVLSIEHEPKADK